MRSWQLAWDLQSLIIQTPLALTRIELQGIPPSAYDEILLVGCNSIRNNNAQKVANLTGKVVHAPRSGSLDGKVVCDGPGFVEAIYKVSDDLKDYILVGTRPLEVVPVLPIP